METISFYLLTLLKTQPEILVTAIFCAGLLTGMLLYRISQYSLIQRERADAIKRKPCGFKQTIR